MKASASSCRSARRGLWPRWSPGARSKSFKPPPPAGDGRLAGRRFRPVAAIAFGLIKRGVGGFDEIPRLQSLAGNHRCGADADGGGAVRAALLIVAQHDHAFADELRKLHGLGSRSVGEQHGEFFAAIARTDVGGPPRAARDAVRNRFESDISRLMAEIVVVCLEMIGIDHQQRDWCLTAERAAPFQFEYFVESSPVAQPGQAVRRGHDRELMLGVASQFERAGQENDQREIDAA